MCTLTDVVDGASTELSVELLGPESPEVVNGVGPEVEHIVPGEGVSFFNHHHLAAQQSQLDGRPKATRTAADDQTLNGRRLQLEWESIIQMSCSRHNHSQRFISRLARSYFTATQEIT